MRLIDADALKKEFQKLLWATYAIGKITATIDNAPTVNIKSFASVTFDKDELEQIVRDKVIEPIKNGELVVKEERPQGYWKKDEWGNISCSNCGRDTRNPHYPFFCCFCGADMKGGIQ